MPRRYRHVLTALFPVVGLLFPATATAATSAEPNGERHSVVSRTGVDPVPEIRAPNGRRPGVPRELSLAARPVAERAVGPEPLTVTTPAGPSLVNSIVTTAKSRMSAAGAGKMTPDIRTLLPAAKQDSLLTPSRDSAPDALGLNKLNGLSQLFGKGLIPSLGKGSTPSMKGVSSVTYRLCVESASRPASCSSSQPLATPVQADVTGDGTADVVATLVPWKGKGWDSVGLGLASTRLPTSETRGGPLKAQVWAEYEFSHKAGKPVRLVLGFDGYRRGSSLSERDWSVFTFNLTAKSTGVVDVRAEVQRTKPGTATAVLAGKDDTLVSLRQAPAVKAFTAHARFERDHSTLGVTSSVRTTLDAVVVTDRQRFTQVVANGTRNRLTAELTHSANSADIQLGSPAAIKGVRLYDYSYADGQLTKATEATLTRLPSRFRATYTAASGKQALTITSTAPRAKAATVAYFDRAAQQTVVRAALTGLPARLKLENDLTTNRVRQTASSPIGGFEVTLQRGQGAISTPRGSHLTMIKDGGRLGVSGRVTNLAGFDVTYGEAARVRLGIASGGRPFVAAASIDQTHQIRLELSNTPAKIRADLRPGARQAEFAASGLITTLRAAYANVRTGPTIDGSLHGIHSAVAASWQLGERTVVDVTATPRLDKIEFYAARAYQRRVSAAADGDDAQVTITGVRGQATADVDTGNSRMNWTADHPLTSVSARARIAANGRVVRAAAEVRDVPTEFDASWGESGVRFHGRSGPIGSATVAITNHDGAQAPRGPHLAAHHVAATGDLDASVRIDGLRHVEFVPNGTGFTADVKAKRQTVALDADVRPAGDLRFGVLGTLGPVPGDITVSAAPGGPITYDTNGQRLNLTAEIWLGKAAALEAAPPVPRLPGGIALVDTGCAGCDPEPGPFCVPERGCFGVKGFVDLTGLPSRLTVDPGKGTFTFTGYQPSGNKLGLYLDSRIVAPQPVRAQATLTGLPSSITSMSVGPFGVSTGKDAEGRFTNVVTATYRVEPAAQLGSLTVLAETDAGGDLGTLRGQVIVNPVPAAVSVTGTYGKHTQIQVRNSTAIRTLQAKVTVLGGKGKPGTGMIRFTDVPASFDLDCAIYETLAGLHLPMFTYKGNTSTLDGLFAVDSALISRVYRPREGELRDTSLTIKDMAANTTIQVNPDLTVDLTSKPVPTRLLRIRTGLSVAAVPTQRVATHTDVPYTNGFLRYELAGSFGLQRSRIGDLTFVVHKMSWLRIRPGRMPIGVTAPPAAGFLTPGFEGEYGRLDLRANDIDLRPDVKLGIAIRRKVGVDVFRDTIRLGPAKWLQLRRYDLRMRPISAKHTVKAVGLPLACVTVDTKPGFVPTKARNSITLRGANGPQVVSLLDPGGQVPGYAIDLLTHFMSPFPGADWKVAAVDRGGC